MSKVVSDVKTASHSTQPGQQVVARATIVHRPKGAWTMLLGDQRKAGGVDPDDVVLGLGEELKGRHLEVSAVIQDVRGDTNELALKVDVLGPNQTTVALSHTGAAGDAAAYSVIIFFS